MSAAERSATLPGPQLFPELSASLDEQTLEILDRRRRTATIRRRGWLVRRLLLVADVIGLVAAVLVSESLVPPTSGELLGVRGQILVFVLSLPLWVVLSKLYGLYDRDEERTDHSTADELTGVFHMVTLSTALFSLLAYVSGAEHPTPSRVITFWATAIALVSVGRSLARVTAHRSVAYIQNTVIVGAGEVGQLIARKLIQHPEYGINLVGFIDSRPLQRQDELGHLALLGGTDRLPAVVRLFDVERVIIAFSNDPHDEILGLVRSLRDLDVQVDIVPRLFETVGPRVGVHTLEGIPLVGLPPLRLSWSSLLVKRALDCAVAAVALVLLAPVLLLIAAVVRLTSLGPALYWDERVGRNGELFRACKFRTMRRDADKLLDDLLARDPEARAEFDLTHKLSQDPRVTRVGRMLRKTSLDELPQLLNVLRGKLSLVGPRPITSYEYRRYCTDGAFGSSQTQSGYWEFDLRPGLTGYWQINGRSSMEYADRLRLDMSYLLNWSVKLDLQILAKTIRVLLSSRGAS